MKSSKMNKMKKRLLALLLCMVMMMNGSVSALASEVTASDEVNAISQDAGTQTASLETVHEHTGECYSRSKVSDALICGKEVVEGHTHGDACYEVTNTPECICTLEETAGHSHDEGCYTTVETKNCSLEEHSHGDGCYTTEFTCGTEEHSHGDECFITETVNVCGQEEVEAHTHGDGCYTTVENKTLTCELEEAEGHAHSDECYEWTEELTCTIPAETPTVEPEITICEVCGKEECECEAEIEICEVCGKETCECEAEEEAEPITLTTEVDGTTITLSGPAEAFAEGMVYSIEAAIVETTQEVEVIEEVLEEVAVEQEKVVKNYQAFDIKIIEKDEEGNVTNNNFQPLNETPVMVTFSSKEVTESVENEETETSVLHVDTEKKEAEDMAAEVTEDKDVAIETTHFSIYVYVELSTPKGTVTLTVEHWVGNDTESVKTNTIILPDGFRGTIDELKTACLSEEALENYILESVYIEEDGDWKLLDDESIITLEKDAKLKLEYNGVESSLPFFNFTPKAESGEKEIYKDKTAEPLDENYVSDVTLQVGGVETGESVDIVFLLGGGMTANKKTVEAAINVFDKVMEQPETKVRIGIISLEKGQEIILDLNSDEAVLDPKTYKEFIAEKFEYINTLPGGTTNLHSQLVEAKKMLDADTEVKASNKYMFVIATGRTYWFDDEKGNQATVVMKTPKLNNGSSGKGAGTYYYYGNYPWQSLRGGHSSLYMVPDGNWKIYWDKVCKWVEADGNTYVYSPLFDKNDYSAYVNWYNQNKDDWRTLYNGGSGTRYGSLIINPVPSAENYITGAVAGITYKSKPEHAMGYERAQYEAAKAYVELVNAGYNCFSLCSETAYYQNNSPYIANRGYTGSSRIQLGHSFMDYLARLGGQKEAAKLFEFLYDENGNCTWEEVLREDFFEQIESEIIKSLSKGSRVEDYIGYSDGSDGREAYNFDFFVTPDANNNVTDFILNIGNDTYTAKVTEPKNGATASYSFNEGKHTVDYYYGDGKTGEHFVWNINEDVVGASAKLTYPVKLVGKSSEPGTHKAYTNRYAVLFPVNSDEEEGEPEYFPTPEVEYKVTRSILVNKVSPGDSPVGLAGAEFTVTKAGETEALTFVQRNANDGEDTNTTYYVCNPEGTITNLVTGSNGKIMIEGLAGVKYQLREIKAPAGYSLSEEVYTIDLSLQNESKNPVTTVDGNDYNEEFVIMTKELVTLTIENLPLYELPSTGGYGSCLYTLGGAVMMLGSSLMKYKKKREQELGSQE